METPTKQIESPAPSTLPLKQNDPEILAIHCPCDLQTQEFDLIECSKCANWGHLVCYGYTDTNDPLLPTDFKCFNCTTSIPNPQFQTLAFKRRLLFSLKYYGYKTKKKLIKDAELENHLDLYQWIIEQGFLSKQIVRLSDQVFQYWMNPLLNFNVKISSVVKDLAVL